MAAKSMADEVIDAILTEHKTTGILLHRPYPPLGTPRVRSRLGGLPNLPDGIEWPHGRSPYDSRKPVPLHFLAQIDCAELPQIDARMPTKGMLFFFAREDEEQIWGQPHYWIKKHEHHAHDDGRVIYAPKMADDQPVRMPPDDLPPIHNRRAGFDPVTPDEPGPSVHFSWPLVAMEFDTWPDSSALAEPVGDGYDERLENARIASVMTATGLPRRAEKPRAQWNENLFPSKPFNLPEIPPVGIMVRRLAYEIAAEVFKFSRSKPAAPEASQIVDDARSWMRRAADVGLDEVMPSTDMHAFEAWLRVLSTTNAHDRESPPLSDRQAFTEWHNSRSMQSWVRREMPGILTRAIVHSIGFLAGSPTSAALIPPGFYDAVESHFLPFDRATVLVHQMLGHAPASQEAKSVESETLCLLQLATDWGVGMEFGDVGEAAFWINPDDLSQNRFENAWVTLQGH
jgi:Domain of unknown function (DUF1963)